MTGLSVMGSWYSVWASSVALVVMCLSISEEGVSIQECKTPLSLAYIVVYRTDANTTADDTKVTIRIIYQDPVNTHKAVAQLNGRF